MTKPAATPADPIAYPPESRGRNFYTLDVNLRRLLAASAPGMLARFEKDLVSAGDWVGGPLDEQAAYSDRHAPPRLETHDSRGNRASRVVFNPLYEAAHQEAYRRGAVGPAFAVKDPAPHLYSFTLGYLMSQADISVHCPVTMTGAVAYVLDRHAPRPVRDAYLHELTRQDGRTKTGGTWATELHGGSDVGATTTSARRHADGRITLHGLKWFTSNANSGLALATARPEGAPAGSKGLGLYLVPSHLADGTPNRYYIRRLKDKLGTKGLATGEIELDGAEAIEVAPPPHGLKTMMEALEYSRVHNAMSAAGVQRRAVLEAACWITHRQAFGRPIAQYPMVQDEVLDILTRAEASAALAFAAARAFDRSLGDAAAQPWLRIVTALAKYRTAEDGVQCAKKALELVGGNGYTEEFPTARQFRDAMVLTVWEGPANIQALELLRLLAGPAEGGRHFLEEVRVMAAGLPPALAAEAALLQEGIAQTARALAHLQAQPADGPRFARRVMDHMADVYCGALLAEEAARDLALGDARKAVIASGYLKKAFGPKGLALDTAPDPAQTHFAAMIGYGHVPPEAAGYAAPKSSPMRPPPGRKP
jgi:alkylation response protein AidB-like acyl-CoA dehydrogenase